MSETMNYIGDNLLSVFEDLSIDLGGLDPNAVRAWFDTDDQDMRNLLNFMCSNLSKENALTAQELDEYEIIEQPLDGPELEAACEEIEREYPGIFNYDLNVQHVKVCTEESRLLKLEEDQLDAKILMQGNLQSHLLQLKSELEEQTAVLEFKCEEIDSEFGELSQELDAKHRKLYEKLHVNLNSLSNFLFHDASDYLNRMDLNDLEDSEEFISSIHDFVRKQHENLSGDFSLININLNSTPNESVSDLETYKNQIYSSLVNYYCSKMEEESLTSILKYLEDFFSKDFLRNTSNVSMLGFGDSMAGHKEVMFNMLKKKALNLAAEPIRQIEIQRAQRESEEIEEKLVRFSQISNYYTKALCVISCSLILFLHEKECLENADDFIRNTSRYILNTLEETKERSEVMLEVQKKSDDFLLQPVDLRNETLSNLMKIYQGNFLKEAFINHKKVLNNLGKLEEKHFICNTIVLSEILCQLYKSNCIEKFLASGPTRELVIIPNYLQRSLKNVRSNLDKQATAIKCSLETVTRTSKNLSSDEFLKDYRLLWVYFLVNPEKFLEVFQRLKSF